MNCERHVTRVGRVVDVSGGGKARAASTFRGSALGRPIAAPVPPTGTRTLLCLVRARCVYSSVVTQRIVFYSNAYREHIDVFRVVILKGDCMCRFFPVSL